MDFKNRPKSEKRGAEFRSGYASLNWVEYIRVVLSDTLQYEPIPPPT